MQHIDSLLSKLKKNLSETPSEQLGTKLCQIVEAMSEQYVGFSPDQLAQYDIMLCQFAADMEAIALSKLAFILSNVETGPPNMICTLAKHDDIVVAGPILASSPMLDESLLCEIVGSQSQMHLQAVSDRVSINELVTTALLENGDSKTTIFIARNPGACFNNEGFAKLVVLSKTNDELAMTVGGRGDIPAQHLEALIRAASVHVLKKLVQANPKIESIVKTVVADATNEVTHAASEVAARVTQAQEYVANLYRNGKLDNNAILDLAAGQAVYRTLIAMAMICRIEAGAAIRAFNESGADTVLMMAKVCELPISAARTVLLTLKRGLPETDIRQAMSTYARLKPETARHVLKLRTQSQEKGLPLAAPKFK
jgi:uncharacterized protein (DUF2336 family)